MTEKECPLSSQAVRASIIHRLVVEIDGEIS